MPRRRKRTPEEKEQFLEYLRELRRRKAVEENAVPKPAEKPDVGLNPQPENREPLDTELFSEGREVYNPPLNRSAGGTRYCQACFQWKGPENFGRTHPDRCWHCVRNPRRPKRAGEMVLPEGWERSWWAQ